MKQKSKLLKPSILKTLFLSPLLITTVTPLNFTDIHTVDKNRQEIATTMNKEQAEKQFYCFNKPEARTLTQIENETKHDLVTKIKKIIEHSHETKTPQLIQLNNPAYIKKLYNDDIEYSEWKYNKRNMGFVFVYKQEVELDIKSIFHHNYRNSNMNDDLMIYNLEKKNNIPYTRLNSGKITINKSVLLKLRLRDNIDIDKYGGFKNEKEEKTIIIKIIIKNKIKEQDIVFNNNSLSITKKTIPYINDMKKTVQVYKINRIDNLTITVKDLFLQQPQYQELLNNQKDKYEKTSYCAEVVHLTRHGTFIHNGSKNYFNANTININKNGIYFLNIIDFLGNEYKSYLEVGSENWDKVEKLNIATENDNNDKEEGKPTAQDTGNKEKETTNSEGKTAAKGVESKEATTAKNTDNTEERTTEKTENTEDITTTTNNVKTILINQAAKEKVLQGADLDATKAVAERQIEQWWNNITNKKELQLEKKYINNSYNKATTTTEGKINYQITLNKDSKSIENFILAITLIDTRINSDKTIKAEDNKNKEETTDTKRSSSSEETKATEDTGNKEEITTEKTENTEDVITTTNNVKTILINQAAKEKVLQGADLDATKAVAERQIEQWWNNITNKKELQLEKKYINNSYKKATTTTEGKIDYKIILKSATTAEEEFNLAIKLICPLATPANTNCDKESEKTKISNQPKPESRKEKKRFTGERYLITKAEQMKNRNSIEKMDITKEEEADIKKYLLWNKPTKNYENIIKISSDLFRIHFGKGFRDWFLTLKPIVDIKTKLRNIKIIYFDEIPKNETEKKKMLSEYLIAEYQLQKDEFVIDSITVENEATLTGKKQYSGSAAAITLAELEEVKGANDDVFEE